MTTWKLVPLVAILAAACGGKGQDQEEEPAPPPPPEAAAPDTGPASMPQVATPASTTPAPAAARRARAPSVPLPAVDEPWIPTDTGTVDPGMTRDDVISVWGAPVTERTHDAWSYLYYRNGCEASCGTFDVVFLEDGKVVNAIVRGRGHNYSGTSTSPPGIQPKPTPPGGGTEGV